MVRAINADLAHSHIPNMVKCTNDTGTLRGEFWWYHAPNTGYLPEEYVEVLRNEFGNGKLIYVVFSYQTPIAWRATNAQFGHCAGDFKNASSWVVPNVRYSVTTTRHQNMLRNSFNLSGIEWEVI